MRYRCFHCGTRSVGYSVWYIALGGLSVTQAAVVQLFVPIIAAIGGVIFTNELITMRLVESSALALGGILIVILGRNYLISRASKKDNKRERMDQSSAARQIVRNFQSLITSALLFVYIVSI
ncbi:MAG: EamA family transporter [Candidatus Reddybacter sp.]